MVDLLRPLAPLGGTASPGLTPDGYAQLRRRQALADGLARGAMTDTGSGGSALSAISQGAMGLASALMRGQSQADITSFGQSSPMAAASLQAGQPQPFDLSAGLGRIFSGFGLSDSRPAEPSHLGANPSGRGDASLSSTPTIGVDWRRYDDA